MTLFESILLGAIQGLTEFLPVSSSGHLVVFKDILGIHGSMIPFFIMVHFGTLFAVVIYFWKDLIQITQGVLGIFFSRQKVKEPPDNLAHPRFAILIIIATLPAVIIGILFNDWFETVFESVLYVGIAWLFMGSMLMASLRFQKGMLGLQEMTFPLAFLIGCAQCIALIPGISRSGTTILAGMVLGLKKEDAARFAFWMAIPVILGAGILELKEGIAFARDYPAASLFGVLTSTGVGFLAVAVLMKLVKKGQLYIFGFYCLIVGLGTVLKEIFF